MQQATVLTSADANYYRFVAPFLYFWLRTNADVAVEVVVQNLDEFMKWNQPQIDFLRSHFADRKFLIRQQLVAKEMLPNTVRFIEVPQIESTYLYIADIDILVLEEGIVGQHIENMQRTGLPYSNIKRADVNKLSGLHFTLSSAYHPLPDISDLNLVTENDEAVLYKIIERKGLEISTANFRPVHGIHVSYNRPAMPEEKVVPGWGITDEYLHRFERLISEPVFIEFEIMLDRGMQNTLDRIRSVARSVQVSSSAAKEAFVTIHQTNEWGAAGSRSGPGSTWSATKLLRHNLRRVLTDLNIRTILDAPCGDANWIAEVAQHLDFYIGVDIVPELIASNLMRHAERNMSFRLADITRDPLPKVDAIFCRDCLVHLPFDLAVQALRRFAFSGSKYLICTTFPSVKENSDTPRPGPWRPLNMQIAPFSLPAPLRTLNEKTAGEAFADKSLGVWRIEDLRSIFTHSA